jgi:hypothetical protein
MLDVRRGPKVIPVASTENSITVADTAFNPTEFARRLRAAETLIRFVTQCGVRFEPKSKQIVAVIVSGP